MNIAVLLIATSFKVRMKIGSKTLMMQSDKQKFAAILDELSIWVENSDEKLTPVIITCFDEIYEMAVERHFKVFSNKFTNVAQWNMIRFGINSCPEFDAYFVVDTNDLRLIKSEVFEQICILSEKNPGKVVLSEYNGSPCLPMVSSKDLVEIVRKIFDDKSGKLNLKKVNSDKILIMQITKELLEENIYKRHSELNKIEQNNLLRDVKIIAPSDFSSKIGISEDVSIKNDKGGKYKVVIIRGGGRVASSLAFMLHENGFKVLITERENPLTLYRGNSFSEAVTEMYKKINGVDAYLVAPGKQQIGKAWEAKVIPVIIDPDLECLAMFDISVKVSSIYDDRLNTRSAEISDPLSYFRNLDKDVWKNTGEPISAGEGYPVTEDDNLENSGDNVDAIDIEGQPSATTRSTLSDNKNISNPDASANKISGGDKFPDRESTKFSDGLESDFHSKYELFAVCDLTSPNFNKPTLKDIAKVTVGINEYHYFYNGPDNLISIKYGFGYGKMIKNPLNSYLYENSSTSETQSNMNSNDERKDERVLYNDQDFICGNLCKHIHISEDGIYREIRKIGDRIEAGDLVGEITNSYNEKIGVTSDVSGTLIASCRQGALCKKGMYVAVIDSSIISKDECYSVFPLDGAIGISVISLFNGSK